MELKVHKTSHAVRNRGVLCQRISGNHVTTLMDTRVTCLRCLRKMKTWDYKVGKIK